MVDSGLSARVTFWQGFTMCLAHFLFKRQIWYTRISNSQHTASYCIFRKRLKYLFLIAIKDIKEISRAFHYSRIYLILDVCSGKLEVEIFLLTLLVSDDCEGPRDPNLLRSSTPYFPQVSLKNWFCPPQKVPDHLRTHSRRSTFIGHGGLLTFIGFSQGQLTTRHRCQAMMRSSNASRGTRHYRGLGLLDAQHEWSVSASNQSFGTLKLEQITLPIVLYSLGTLFHNICTNEVFTWDRSLLESTAESMLLPREIRFRPNKLSSKLMLNLFPGSVIDLPSPLGWVTMVAIPRLLTG